jgi:alpha-beta hydrolase superfamily lysophospholipase
MKFNEWKWKTGDGLEMYSGEWVPDEEACGVICLVHGVGEHIGRYQWVGEAFSAAGYILAGFDIRGFGKSEGRRGYTPTLEAYFDDIDAFLAQAAERHPGLPRFLYGHSMGGNLVLAYPPVRHPAIAGVIVSSPGLKSELENQKAKVFLTKLLGKTLPAFSLKSGLDATEICRDPKVIEAYLHDPLVHSTVTAGWGFSMLKSIELANQYAPRFPVPLLLMHGSGDKIDYPSGSECYADMAPKDKVTLKIWDGMKHELHTDPDREQVFNYMVGWLDDILIRSRKVAIAA